MLTYFNNFCKKSNKKISIGSLIGAVGGGISTMVALSNACSNDMSLGICTNNYSGSQVAAATAGALVGAASGACLGVIYPACETFIGWCYNNHPLRSSRITPENNLNDSDIGQDLGLSYRA